MYVVHVVGRRRTHAEPRLVVAELTGVAEDERVVRKPLEELAMGRKAIFLHAALATLYGLKNSLNKKRHTRNLIAPPTWLSTGPCRM